MGNGVLIGFVNISAKLMPNHKFFLLTGHGASTRFLSSPWLQLLTEASISSGFLIFRFVPGSNFVFLQPFLCKLTAPATNIIKDRQYLQFEKDHLAYGWELCIIEFRRHLRLCYIPPWASTHCYRLRWSRTQYSLKQKISDISLNGHNINSRWPISQRSLEKTFN